MLRWIFFDVGNVLLDEDPLTYRTLRRHAEAIERVQPRLSFHHLLAEREARAATGERWPLASVVRQYLDEAECDSIWRSVESEIRSNFAALSPAVTGAFEVIERLGARYHLGIIANQGAEYRAQLAALGWLDRFDVVALSEEQGLYKPDPELFQTALSLARTAPANALMVGDRLDNDIAPAAAVGMATAWVRWPCRAAKGWPVEFDSDATDYLASLERSSACVRAQHADVRPTIAVDTVAEVSQGILDWVATSRVSTADADRPSVATERRIAARRGVEPGVGFE